MSHLVSTEMHPYKTMWASALHIQFGDDSSRVRLDARVQVRSTRVRKIGPVPIWLPFERCDRLAYLNNYPLLHDPCRVLHNALVTRTALLQHIPATSCQFVLLMVNKCDAGRARHYPASTTYLGVR